MLMVDVIKVDERLEGLIIQWTLGTGDQAHDAVDERDDLGGELGGFRGSPLSHSFQREHKSRTHSS
ncbi:hypothetical protein GCM10008955_39490 [Deinococcus malanensis]|uniref:Uncharacterized protein n=1 Tax=Deinococcus malanensis TaxID=1706855 RepID=A0ABQ2F5H3_9DEIO|nr:hypothetical protein GCM10008955_39490 [Deinococcus malanensis]